LIYPQILKGIDKGTKSPAVLFRLETKGRATAEGGRGTEKTRSFVGIRFPEIGKREIMGGRKRQFLQGGQFVLYDGGGKRRR